MIEIDNAVNLINFDIGNDIFNDDKIEKGSKTFKNENFLNNNIVDKMNNPLIKDLESNSKYNNKNDTYSINRITIMKA